MESTENLKKKITAADSLRSIVKTMKVLSAVSLRQHEKLVATVEEYRNGIEMGLVIAVRSSEFGVRSEDQKSGPTAKTAAIVFGSDLGLCGQFNERLIAKYAEKPADRLIVVGEKMASKLEDAGIIPGEKLVYPANITVAIAGPMSQLLETVQKWRDTGGVSQVDLYYNCPETTGVGYYPVIQRLMPVDETYLNSLKARPWKSRSIPRAMWDRDNLFASLIKGLLYSYLYRAFVDSLTAENSARLASMQAAEQHIEEHLEELNLEFNQARQDAITSEMLDIISGAEAVEGEAGS